MSFRFVEHQADVAFIAKASNKNKLFLECVKAFNYYVSAGKKSKANKKVKFSITGKDDLELLYKFLEEVIYLLDSKGILASLAKFKLSEGKISGEIFGSDKVTGISSVKAPTYAEMYIDKRGDHWEAKVVLDV